VTPASAATTEADAEADFREQGPFLDPELQSSGTAVASCSQTDFVLLSGGRVCGEGTLDELTRLVGQEDVVELSIAAEHSTPDLLKALAAVPGVRGR